MEDIFITDIEIKKVRHLKDLKIHLSNVERKHLILTGKNGSGKTSVLEEINQFLIPFLNGDRSIQIFLDSLSTTKHIYYPYDEPFIKESQKFKNCYPIFNKLKENNNNFVYSFFKAKRPLENMIDYSEVEKGFKLELPTTSKDKLNKYFLYYIVKKQNAMGQYYLKGDINEVENIKEWFDRFEKELNKLFNEKEKIKLDYEVEEEKFYVLQDGKEKFDFNQFSDGYKSILAIVSEIIMQSDINKKSYEEIQGIVLIDEVETHLHLELQKQILPFLITLFPKIQFIVTTHSPFVLNSIENAVIYDLENNKRVEDLQAFSYEGLAESYFNVDEYSNAIKKKLKDYKDLKQKETLTEEEKKEVYKLQQYLKRIPEFLSPELALEFKQIERNYG